MMYTDEQVLHMEGQLSKTHAMLSEARRDYFLEMSRTTQMRDEIKEMHAENKRLRATIEDMERTVARLHAALVVFPYELVHGTSCDGREPVGIVSGNADERGSANG